MTARLERLIELGLNVVITEEPSIFSEEARLAGEEIIRKAHVLWDECQANGGAEGGGGSSSGHGDVKKFGPVRLKGKPCTLFATKDEELEGSPDKTDEVVAEVEALGEERSVEMDISGDSPSAVANMIGELAKQSATAATTGNPARKTAGDSTPESNPTLTLTLP